MFPRCKVSKIRGLRRCLRLEGRDFVVEAHDLQPPLLQEVGGFTSEALQGLRRRSLREEAMEVVNRCESWWIVVDRCWFDVGLMFGPVPFPKRSLL